jgi:hypothetical protein
MVSPLAIIMQADRELRAISRDAMAGKNELARMRLAQAVESWHCGLAQNLINLSAWRYISFLLMRRAPLLHFLPPTVLSIFY